MSYIPPPMPAKPLNYAPPPGRTDLREVAVRQRAIMLCILGYIVLLVLRFVVPPPFNLFALLAAFAVSITAMVFVFMLSVAIYNTGMGIFLGILTLVPLVNLIVLLIINGKATKILREHGIKVGLMGADTSQIPAPGQTTF